MKNSPRVSLTYDQLVTQARQFLEQGRFKEAINAYKELIKTKPDTALNQELATAYRERAMELASKDMHPESIILWETQARLTEQSPWAPCYTGWLFKTGQYAKLASQVHTVSEILEPSGQARPALETLAILALDDPKLLSHFPADHPIVKHHPAIFQAINAYAAGKDEEVQTCLQLIPSRSPYREVRTLLKGLLNMDQDRSTGIELLGTIDHNSVLAEMAQHLCRHATRQGVEAVHYQTLGGKLQTLVNRLNGYGKNQLDLLKNLKKLNPESSDRLRFEFALNNRQALGDESARRYCKALLFEYSDGIKLFERHFGLLPQMEKCRLEALSLESEHYLHDAIINWLRYANHIRNNTQEEDTATTNLTEAIILRHCFELAEKPNSPGALKWLAKSLTLDPDDKRSYLILINGYLPSNPKESQNWLDKALKQFPEDLDILARAMYAAAERKAFKKAASYAQSILNIDSLNSHARTFLIEAHLGHARKKIKAGRLDHAEQEILLARDLDTNQRNSHIIYLQALVFHLQNNTGQSASLLNLGLSKEGNSLCAELGISMERFEINLPSWGKAKYPGFINLKNHQPDRNELLTLVRKINNTNKSLKSSLSKALNVLRPTLVRGIKSVQLTQDEFMGICEVMLNLEEYDILKALCAQFKTQEGQAEAAIIPFYTIIAKCKGDPSRLGIMDLMQLHALQSKAQQAQDNHSLKRINQFIGRYLSQSGQLSDESDDDDHYPDVWNEVYETIDTPNHGRTYSVLGLYDRNALLEEINNMGTLSDREMLAFLGKIYKKTSLRNLSRERLNTIYVDYLMEKYNITASELVQLIG